MITVVDYGMGNLRNVRRAFEEIGEQVAVTAEPARVLEADRIVLPGVGAFGEAVSRIDALGIRESLAKHVERGKPLLGICLGMQLLFEHSEESPGVSGLGFLPGKIRRFKSPVKVPHIGWNDVAPIGASKLFDGQSGSACFYFVHSYYLAESDSSAATTDYGTTFVSAVEHGNLFGVQFHPEKSQSEGRVLLQRFVGAR